MVTDQEDRTVETLLGELREAIVIEKAERTNAHFEAKTQAEKRIERAHKRTVESICAAYQAGATKTMIANQLGIRNLGRVGQLIDEGTACAEAKMNTKETN